MIIQPFDEAGAFKPFVSIEGSELRQRAVKGAGVTLLSGGASLAIQIIGTMILARLLGPREFGLVTMVTTFSLLLVSFGENGLPEAVVQREDINHRLASNLFWINSAAGLFLTLCFAAAGPVLAYIYKNRDVAYITLGIAATIFLTSISVLHLALLKRAMRFSEVSLNSICARLASVVTSITLGWAGWGYWALVAGAIALPVSQCLGALWLCRWVPAMPAKVDGTWDTLRFAIHAYGRFGVNYFTRNADNLLVGWRFDAHTLGVYKKAYDLFALSATQCVHSLTLVAVSALSRMDAKSEAFRQDLVRALTVMAFVGMGLGADLTLIGKDIIRILLGPKWDESGAIFAVFGPGVGAMMLYYTHGWIHLSIGRADRWLRWGLIEFAVTLALFLAGLRWGPVGIAGAWTLSYWILTIPAIWYAGKPVNLRVQPVIGAVWRYAAASIGAGSAASMIADRIPALAQASGAPGAGLRIVVVSMLLGGLYLMAVALLHGSVEPLQRIGNLLSEMIPGARSIRALVAKRA